MDESSSHHSLGDQTFGLQGGERLAATTPPSAPPSAPGKDANPLSRRSAELTRRAHVLIGETSAALQQREGDLAKAEEAHRGRISAAANRDGEVAELMQRFESAMQLAGIHPRPAAAATPVRDEEEPIEELKRLLRWAHTVVVDTQNRFFKGSRLRLLAEHRNAMEALADRISEEGEEDVAAALERTEVARQAVEGARRDRDSRVAELRVEAIEFEASLPPGDSGWTAPSWEQWAPAPAPTGTLRLGSLVPTAAWLPSDLRLPLILDFPAGRSLLLLHDGQRDRAAQALQAALLRIMAGLPPASYEFSFIDPVGLGQTVAPFLHLAEFDDAMVGGRVATQRSDIEGQIGRAVVHVETVVQQYLRSNYATIDEYNEDAGEIAERYRFLVISDFPAGMDEQTVAKVASLIEHGPRAGLYVLAMGSLADASGLDAALLSRAASVVEVGSRTRGIRGLAVPGGMMLAADTPPSLAIAKEGEPQELFAQVLTSVGLAARGTVSDSVSLDRVYELRRRGGATPFASREESALDPGARETWWQESSLSELRVPVGRAGARDLCTLPFDSRTLAGALVVGAPGSGKTTLLHAVILGLAMAYSPAELEMYLLDSKQGVEFKVYERLPHARAIAIRNEREFGVSVLAGLRAELDRRAALIKQATNGSQVDLPGYRQETGDPMPRILLVADEFHELFERVDRLGQQAADLLDDLVRQGRSYGIHVLLGSQTLDGVEALPRHTLQLVQGRVAFACREQDAIVAMREDNREVRTLSRPGDGIWNPERGDPEANVRFQGLLIEPRTRVELNRALRELADASGHPERPVVFDGDEAFPMDEIPIEEFASGDSGFRIRLGEPCSVAAAAWASFPRRPGSNLLVVAPDQTARAALHACLAAAAGGEEVEATLVDLLGDEDPAGEAFSALPRVRMVRRAGAGAQLRRIAGLVAERTSLDDYRAPTRLLIVNGLKGLRDAEAPLDEEDGRSFAELFEAIAKDGPEVGVHVVVIGDTLATVDRRLGLQVLSDFGLLLAGPMSRDDSERLLQAELAAELKPTQAVLRDDSNDEMQKLRCYEPATANWVRAIDGVA